MVRNLWAAHIDYSLAKCAFDSLLDVWESDNTQSLKVDIILHHNVRLLPHNWIIFLQLIDSVPQILLLCWDSFHLCFSILHHPLCLKKLKKRDFSICNFTKKDPVNVRARSCKSHIWKIRVSWIKLILVPLVLRILVKSLQPVMVDVWLSHTVFCDIDI